MNDGPTDSYNMSSPFFANRGSNFWTEGRHVNSLADEMISILPS